MNSVCPDRQMLSIYFDGELPSPWKEKMEAHIAECPQCAQALEAYRRIALPIAADDADIGKAQDRVWQKLEQRVSPAAYSASARGAAMWRRRISIPLPAAAAALAIVALAFLLVFKATDSGRNSGMIFASETDFDMPGIIPVSDMENVLQYLDSRDNGDIIILRLPESRNFVNYGEPAIIKAADYSRQVSSRHMPVRRRP